MKQKLLYTIIALMSAGLVSAQKPWSLQGNFTGEKSVNVIEANSGTGGTTTGASVFLTYDLNLKSVNIPSVVQSGQQFTISGTVKNAALATITSFDVQYKIGTADLQTQTFSGLNIANADSYTFSIDAMTNETGTLPVTLTVTNLNAGQTDENPSNNSYSTTIAASNTVFPRKFVEEEGTSSGCGWCPRGIVGMAYMKETYPQRFIGISVHGNMSWADPMIQTTYLNGLSGLGLTGFPEASYNRLIIDDPAADYADYYYHFLDSLSIFSLSTNANYHDAAKTSIDIITSLTSGLDVSALNANLAYVIIENDVHGTASGYNQANYYAGGGNGVMGGFELLPSTIPAAQMYYQEVARGIFPSFKGANGSVPTQLTANVSANYNYKITLPTSILNKDNIELITLLLDKVTGEILNAEKSEIGAPTAIATINTDNKNIYYANKTLFIQTDERIKNVEVYTVAGQKIFTVSTASANIPMNLGTGIYVVKVQTNNGYLVRKIVVE